MDPLLVVILLALCAATAAMLLGILVMSGGGATDAWLSTPLMWVRIGFQALTVVLLIVAAALH